MNPLKNKTKDQLMKKIEALQKRVEELEQSETLHEKAEETLHHEKNKLLKQGGPGIRVRYQKEQGFIPVFEEINTLGAKLGLRPIGLGHLRK